MRFYLTKSELRPIVQSMVIFILTFFGINHHLYDKLQSVQKFAARIIYGRSRYDHVTDPIYQPSFRRNKQEIDLKSLLNLKFCRLFTDIVLYPASVHVLTFIVIYILDICTLIIQEFSENKNCCYGSHETDKQNMVVSKKIVHKILTPSSLFRVMTFLFTVRC